MAAYDFPPTAGQPTDGSFEYTAPDGTLYEWNGYAWIAPFGDAQDIPALDARYVNVTGDNMTGDLTLGTDKITLNADGSAEFAGNAIVSDGSSTGITLNKAGAATFDRARSGSLGGKWVFLQQDKINNVASVASLVAVHAFDGSTRYVIDSVGNHLIGTALDVAPAATTLNSDGSAAFAGEVSTRGWFRANRPLNLNYCFEGQLGGVQTSVIYGNGSAEFAGNAIVSDGSSTGITLNKAGAATFDRARSGSLGGKWVFLQQTTINNASVSSLAAVHAFEGSTRYVIDASGNHLIGTALDVAPAATTLNSDGSAAFAGTVTATVVPPSDARFKENITPANPQLADVVALGGLLKNYDWNADAPVNDELRAVRQLGLIAQEAETVCPGLVKTITRTKQGPTITPAVTDSEGNETTTAVYEELDDSYKGLSTDVIIMKLLGAVAELSAKVAALEAS